MKFVVRGGKPLYGVARLSGSKNAATKLMLASLLTDEPCTLQKFPSIGDTAVTAELLRAVGGTAAVHGGVATLQAHKVASSVVPELSRRNRIPILAVGPLLARTGSAEVPVLGGDRIGPRPVNLHLVTLRLLGAEVEETPNGYVARAPNGLHGAKIALNFPSVGATETSILASVLAKGETAILGAALEPEIMSLIKMLQKMGAIIELGANRDIYIEGVPRLRGVVYEVPPDRNEAVSFACLAIATGGKILVGGAIQDHLITFLNVVRKIGAEYEVVPEGIVFSRPNSLKAIRVETAPHPGFATDWQQPLAVLLTQARGTSVIHETIYEDRLAYAADLNSLGARAVVEKDCPEQSPCRFRGKEFAHVARIEGPTELVSDGKCLMVRDLRAGMISVTAALVTKGQTEIEGVEEIDRGYERIDERLRELGADIKREGSGK